MEDAAQYRLSRREVDPTQRELRRSIFQLVWPATVESVLQMGIGLVNTGMVGHLSALAIGAVGLANRAVMVAWALFQAVSTGATVLVAQSIGAGDQRRAKTVAVQALLFGTLSVLSLAVVYRILATEILAVFRPSRELLQAGAGYLKIVALGMPAVGLMTAAGACMRGSGDTRTPMVIAILVNVLNVAGNSVLIYGKLGFAAMGITGSAIATVMAQWTGGILAFAAVTSRNNRLSLSWKGPWRLSLPELRRLMAIGIPASAESIFWQAAAIILMMYITGFGTAALAAHQLGLNAESISYMPTAGFGIAATTLVGQAIGAGNLMLAKRCSRELGYWAAALTAVTAGILFIMPETLLKLLTNDRQVIQLGAVYLRLMATAQIPQQLGGVLNGALRGAGETRTPMYIAAAGLWGIRLPLSYVFGFKLNMGITGVWLAMTIDLFARSGLTAIRYRRMPWVSGGTNPDRPLGSPAQVD